MNDQELLNILNKADCQMTLAELKEGLPQGVYKRVGSGESVYYVKESDIKCKNCFKCTCNKAGTHKVK